MKHLLATIVLFGLIAAGCATSGQIGSHWVGTWGTSPQLTEPRNLPPAPGLAGNTLRQVVHVSIGGRMLRVHFSNSFGNAPLTITSARLAPSAGGSAIKSDGEMRLTFASRETVTIPPGESVVSDPVHFDLAPLSDVAVTVYFGGTPTDVTGHPGSRATSFLQAGDASASADLTAAVRTQHWYFLTGIDVQASPASAAIAVLGDSITDGRGSEPDHNNRWPDDLAQRLQANPACAVINEGIGGNCVVRGGLGPTAVSRFDRDVLGQDAVRWLIILEGVNDIGGSRGTDSTVADDLTAAYESFIARAHSKQIRVYGATILPFGGSQYASPAHEAARQAVNRWIRNSGKFDAVIDFDTALRDPQNPARLLPIADSGDHLHPGVKGYQMMANAIDLKLFKN